jgi:excisionase family DNA binding protein
VLAGFIDRMWHAPRARGSEMTAVSAQSPPMTPVSAEEMSRLLGCGVRTVHAMATDGRIPFLMVGKRRRFEPERVFEALRLASSSRGMSQLECMMKPSGNRHLKVEAMRQ